MTTQAFGTSFDSHPVRRFGGNRLVTHKKDLLHLGDLTSEDLGRLCQLAIESRADPERHGNALHGQSVLCWLGAEAPSVAGTVAKAVCRLGGVMVVVNPAELLPARVGTIENAGRVLSGLGRVIVLGGLPERDVARLAKAASVPVLNAFSDRGDLCQALADLITVADTDESQDDRRARDGYRPLSLQQRDNQVLAYQAVIYALSEGLLDGEVQEDQPGTT